MPSYEFKCDACGAVEERYLTFANCPEPGSVLTEPCRACGKPRLTRIISTNVSFADAKLRVSLKYPYSTRQFHPKQLDGIHRTDPSGHAIIESSAHEKDVMARNGLKRS